MDTQQRVVAVRARLRELQIEEAKAELLGPPCSQCRNAPIDGDINGKCDHIAHWERRFDPAIGKWRTKPLTMTIKEARSPEGLCGPEGLLFEPYTAPRKVARFLARHGPWPLFYGGLGLFGVASSIAITILGRW